MAAVLEYYHGAVTWTDWNTMPYRDQVALEERMVARLKESNGGES